MTSNLTSATLTPFTAAESDGYGRDGASLYRVTPGKGSRVTGTLEVSVTYCDAPSDGRSRGTDPDAEKLVELSLTSVLTRRERGVPEREDTEPLTLNGRPMSSWWRYSVRFVPARIGGQRYASVAHENWNYGDGVKPGQPIHLSATLLGELGHWVYWSSSDWSDMSDSARRIMAELANTLALTVTDRQAADALLRPRQHRIDSADAVLRAARVDLEAAQRAMTAERERLARFLA